MNQNEYIGRWIISIWLIVATILVSIALYINMSHVFDVSTKDPAFKNLLYVIFVILEFPAIGIATYFLLCIIWKNKLFKK